MYASKISRTPLSLLEFSSKPMDKKRAGEKVDYEMKAAQPKGRISYILRLQMWHANPLRIRFWLLVF